MVTTKQALIALDPGHGLSNSQSGIYDPGAVHTEDGILFEEATIALDYATALRTACVRQGLRVFLTRSQRADACPRNSRTAAAAREDADCLVSLHLNDAEVDTANGLEVLWRTPKSQKLAEKVQSVLCEQFDLRDRGVKHRPDLAVLRYDVSILIELGFIANDHDRRLLLLQRDSICYAIAETLAKWKF